jgi:hypothetical protein
MGNREAIDQVALGKLVRDLPGQFCCIGDCAYTPSEKHIPIYRADSAKYAKYDNFNFFASQLRIRVEMAFGIMVNKWRILKSPLSMKISHLSYLVNAIGKLHNFTIDERMKKHNGPIEFENWQLENSQNIQRYADSNNLEWHQLFNTPWSANRERMVKRVENFSMQRPNKRRRGATTV